MTRTIVGVILGVAIMAGVYFVFISNSAEAGPYGGDVVPIANGDTYAEVLANTDTGELMVHTWDKDQKTARPITSEPLTIGSGDKSVTLEPHPTPTDPPGYCSRFYGQADWVRGGGVHHGWLSESGHAQHPHEFAWKSSWGGGQQHGSMWQQMAERSHPDGTHHGPPGNTASSPGHHGGSHQ